MDKRLLRAISVICALILIIMVMGLSNFAEGSHECHEEHCFICSLSAIAQRICSVFVSFQIITVNIFIALFALKELIFCVQKIPSPVFLKVKINC